MRKPLMVVILAAGVLSAGTAFAVTTHLRDKDVAAHRIIHQGYTVDIEDTAKLMDFAEEVFLGRVIDKAKILPDEASTVWNVQVLDHVKGEIAGLVTLKQRGFEDEKGTLYETDEQPLLSPGKEYLLLTTRSTDGENLLIQPGPRSAVLADSTDKKSALKKEYQYAEKLDSGLDKRPAKSPPTSPPDSPTPVASASPEAK